MFVLNELHSRRIPTKKVINIKSFVYKRINMYIWLLTIGLLLFIYLKMYRPHQYWKDLNIPYDKPWPIVGSMGHFALRLKSMPDWVNDMYHAHSSRYFGFYQLLTPTLMIKDIELIKQIAIKDFENFTDHRSFISEDAEPIFGKNLLSLKGDHWKNMRSTLSPAFTGSKMRSMFNLISECAEQFTNHFAQITNTETPVTFEMKDVYTRYTNDVIATCAFGVKCDSLEERDNRFYVMGRDAVKVDGLGNLIFMCYAMMPSIMNYFKISVFNKEVTGFFKSLIITTIQTREEKSIVRPDMIHLLMEARKGQLEHEVNDKLTDTSDGFATVEESRIGTERNNKLELSDDDITAQAFLFFIAGFDTESTLLCMMSHELAINPDIQNKLFKEINNTLSECNNKVTYEAVLKMKYLDMVISESLRKWPPGPVIDRVCSKPYTIQSANPSEKPVHLEKGVNVWFPIFAIHRDPQYYPNPEKFDPERFSDDNKINIQPFTYIPFGIGPRNCIGSRFALLEAKVIFIHLLAKFQIEVVEKTQIPLRFSRSKFNVSSEKGYWLGLKLRK